VQEELGAESRQVWARALHMCENFAPEGSACSHHLAQRQKWRGKERCDRERERQGGDKPQEDRSHGEEGSRVALAFCSWEAHGTPCPAPTPALWAEEEGDSKDRVSTEAAAWLLF
jgi:hypothetical protein